MTQQEIPITYAHSHSSIRLLELPPDLLALIENSPAHTPPLSFKSSQPSASGTSAPSHIVLTTPDRTYQIREVQTSNSVFLLRPRHTNVPEDDTDMVDGDGEEDGTSANRHNNRNRSDGIELEIFSQAPSYLETTPLPAPTPSNKLLTPTQWLTRALPLYMGPADADPDLSSSSTTKTATFAEIPYSSGEIQAAWSALLAFETQGQCFRPSDSVLAELWGEVVTAAGAEGIKLSGEVHADTVWDAVTGDAPRSLYDAVLTRLAADNTATTLSATTHLNRARTVAWTGKTLLSALSASAAPGTALDVPLFIAKWQDALPEEWRDDARPEAMIDLQSQASDGAESARVKELVQKTGLKGDQKGNVGGAKEAVQKRGGPARDWHERFKRIKK